MSDESTDQPARQPFHRSCFFLSIAEPWRREFLWRNPDVVRARSDLAAVRPPADLAADHPLMQRAAQAAADLADRFGVFYHGPRYEEFLGIDWGGSSYEENFDLWATPQFGIIPWESPYRDAIVRAWNERFGAWWERQPGSRETSVPGWDDLTARQKRDYRALVDRLRAEFRLPQPRRQSDVYYGRLLAIWDVREGWTGEDYDPARAVTLKRAQCQVREKTPDVYYRAFHLITGELYSEIQWAISFGRDFHAVGDPEAYRRHQARPIRRRAGRKPRAVTEEVGTVEPEPRGVSRSGSVAGRTGRVFLSARLDNQGVDAGAAEAVARFYALLRGGVEMREAAIEANLAEDTIRLLLDPAKVHIVNEWVDRQRSG